MSAYDEFEVNFPQGVNFLQNLRSQLDEVDAPLSNSVSLVTNYKKGVMYIRGTTRNEKYMWVLWDYLDKIPGIIGMFKAPSFGLECIEFKFLQLENVQLQPREVLIQCLKQRLNSSQNPQYDYN